MVKVSKSIENNMHAKLQNKKHDEYPSLKAFVIVSTAQEKNYLFKRYQHEWRWTFKRIFCNCFWRIEDQMHPAFKLKNQYCI